MLVVAPVPQDGRGLKLQWVVEATPAPTRSARPTGRARIETLLRYWSRSALIVAPVPQDGRGLKQTKPLPNEQVFSSARPTGRARMNRDCSPIPNGWQSVPRTGGDEPSI